jgi:hypothetical protein
MASFIFDSLLDDQAQAKINFASDTFKCMLLTNAATPSKTAWLKRSDVTNEVAATGGYTAGGVTATVTATKDTVNHREDISLGGISISSATITARYAVYYKSRGGLASADELVAVIDFGSDVTSTAGTWALTASTFRTQN